VPDAVEPSFEPTMIWAPSPEPTFQPTVEYNESSSDSIPGGSIDLANLKSPSPMPSRRPQAQPTPRPSRQPTPSPTVFISPTKNATLDKGYLTVDGEYKGYVGTNSSVINSIIWNEAYFHKIDTTQMVNNLRNEVWLSGEQGLNFLILIGNYTADVPIVLPSQFILVMQNASLHAVPNFPLNSQDLQFGTTIIHKNDLSAGGNTMQVMETNWAVIVLANSFFSGVVSPGGPSDALISCADMPYVALDSKIKGPAGIFMGEAGATYIDGIHVDKCGLDNGNIVISGISRSEVTNVLSTRARSRGIWLITVAFSLIHDNIVTGSRKFGIDVDAYVGPVSVLFRNNVYDNDYQGLFLEQGSQQGIVTDNIAKGNFQGVSFYNNIFPKATNDMVVLGNIVTDSKSSGINIGSLVTAAIGYYATTNTYVIGNTVLNNGLNNLADPKKRFGITSNGPVHGLVLMANNDTTGINDDFWRANKLGCIQVIDPLKRVTYRKTNVQPKSSTNITITDGVVTSLGSFLPVGTDLGSTMSSIQAFLTTYFGGLLSSDAELVPWIWAPSAPQVVYHNVKRLSTMFSPYS
jgi:hypothetical protein